jgi:Nuclease-related domain
MNTWIGGLIPTLIAVSAAWLVVTFIGLVQKWNIDIRRRSPFTSDFLRNPGHTLFRKLDDARGEIMVYMSASMTMPVLMFSVPVTHAWWSERPITTGVWVFHGVLAIGVSIWLGTKLTKAIRRVEQLRLGYEGELAVAQELNQLMSAGYRVYHDFPADGFNVDFVVIGPTGVFAVETKARRKLVTGDGRADAQVEYTGQVLRFPSWTDRKTLDQAHRQAQWLSRWLSSAVGESVPVRAAVALPGWYVTQTGRGDALVFNGKRPDTVFPKVRGRRISPEMVQRIAHQVEAKCRDVAPRAYGDPVNAQINA